MTEIPGKIERHFDALVEKHGLSNHRRELRRDLRPVFSILTDKRVDKPGTSRVGGVPDVPDDFKWPACRLGNLLFVAQINLNELPDFVDPLPRRGYMLFFSGAEGGNARVFWYPEVPNRLVRPVMPDGESFTPGLLGYGPVFAPKLVRFEPGVCVPPIHPLRCDDDEFWDRHYEFQSELEGNDSRLLGYSYYDPIEAGLDGGFGNWETLLQVDSFRPCDDMLWADNGKLAFHVRKGGINKCDFGQAVSCILGAG